MDVEKIQKINDLATNLLKQGLANDKDEAIFQAEEILSSKKQEGRQDEKKVQIAEQKKEDEDNMNVKSNVRGFPDKNYGGNEFSSERVQDILEKNTKYVVKALKDFQTKVETMERKFMVMEKELMNLKRSLPDTPIVEEVSQAPSIEISPANEVDSVQSEETESESEPVSNVVEPTPVHEQVPKNKTEDENENRTNDDSAESSKDPHPKVGRYDDQDVSVENIFYMGSKK